MADSTTTVLGLVKPEVGASTDNWGPKINANSDAIDALFTDATKKMLKLANGGTGADTAAGARTALGLGALAVLSAVGTAQITDANVTTGKLADGAATTAKIADGSITSAKLASGVIFPSGTKMLFQQTAAPTGWTKDTTHDNKALRVVSGTAGSGGTMDFTSAFTSRTLTGSTGSTTAGGTVGNTTLTIAQIPSHAHNFQVGGSGSGYLVNTAGGSSAFGTSFEGGGQPHTHTFTGTSHNHTVGIIGDFTVKYVDLIIATKD